MIMVFRKMKENWRKLNHINLHKLLHKLLRIQDDRSDFNNESN